MSMSVAVHIHPSQFPHAVAECFARSLLARQMHHAFHYGTPKQTLRWLRVHEAFSPARRDPGCQAAYSSAADAAVAAMAGAGAVDVIGLGCGGGQKEAGLLRALLNADPRLPVRYVPADTGVGLALVSRDAALAAGVASEACAPLVLDLATAEDWDAAVAEVLPGRRRRLVTFFGMLPNFLPGEVLSRLRGLLAPGDRLLVSANLAPGEVYAAGVERILPLYDNEPTREWLLGVLLDIGVERDDGVMEVRVASCPEGSGLLRVEATFRFARGRQVTVEGEPVRFDAGECFRLFYSYRHTVDRVAAQLASHGIAVDGSWTDPAGDEGVFLARRM